MQAGFYLDVLGIHIVMIDLACQWIESMGGDDWQDIKLQLLKQARQQYNSMSPAELAEKAGEMLRALEESKVEESQQADPPVAPVIEIAGTYDRR